MRNGNRYAVCLVTAAAVLSGAGCGAGADEIGAGNDGASIIYDGTPLEFDTAPVNENGTILVPMRAVFEALGAKVKWDSDTKTVSAKKSSKTYEMTLGETKIRVSKDGEETGSAEANEAMQLINDRTMIPLRALGELFGLDVGWDGDTKTVTLDTPEEESDDSWKDNSGKIDLDDMSVSGEGVSVSGRVVTISEGGDIEVSGEAADARIVVDTDGKVRLKLDGARLASSDGAAIYVKSADKCCISLESGTESTVSDGGVYSDTAETNGCIYSKDKLEIRGGGTLNVNGNVYHGIAVKDNLEISEGTVNITAACDGIHIKDTFELTGGTVNITAAGDGTQSESIIDISGGRLNITCTGDSADDENAASSKGLKSAWMTDVSGGEINISSKDMCVKCDSEINISGGALTLSSESSKGIKGSEDINIDGGTVRIEKSTEGIEAKRILTVNGGDIDITASDDGINAGGNGEGFDGMGGGMNFGGAGGSERQFGGETEDEKKNAAKDEQRDESRQSGMVGGRGMRGGMRPGAEDGMMPPEMPDGEMPQRRGGDMAPPGTQNGGSSDGMMPPEMPDGGMPEPPEGGFGGGRGGMGGAGATTASSEHHIEINGGTLYINAGGDGIDSNGSIVINGGEVIVDGPTSSGNSAMDSNGLFQVNGGTLIAAGAAGMIENPSDTSAQNVISAYITGAAGQTVTIRCGGGTIFEYKLNKAAGHIIFSSADIKTGETCAVYVDGEEQGSAAIESALTRIGEGSAFGGMGGRRGGIGSGRAGDGFAAEQPTAAPETVL